jgi:HptB-dependent secretion and biofilm anti anti-sigma factor
MIEATHNESGSTTITIRGKFNFACYDEFHRVVGRDVRTSYTVDLRDVEYLDSAALGMLLLLRERVKDDRQRVTILAGSGQPAEVLRLANFGTLFTLN